MPSVSLSRLTGIYLRIGNLTFGGGDPTMAAFYREFVENRRWLTAEAYGLVFALARITPGTNLLAFCAGSAWAMTGWRGAALAVLAATVPATILIVFLSAGYDALQANPRAMAAVGGVLAAAVGMMATGAWQLLARQIKPWHWHGSLRALILAGAALLLSFRFQMPPVQVLALAAAAGFLWQAPPRK
jgi:chromate transporter